MCVYVCMVNKEKPMRMKLLGVTLVTYDRLLIKVKFLVWSNLNVIEMRIEKFKFVLIFFGVLVFRSSSLTQCVYMICRK